MKGAWSFLKPPSQKDVEGKRKRQKAFDLPAPAYELLAVLDLEWTADSQPRADLLPEIIELSAVMLRLVGSPTASPARMELVDEFQVFVKPVENPVLTPFSIQLCDIQQTQVDNGETLENALAMFHAWLARFAEGGNQSSNARPGLASPGFAPGPAADCDEHVHTVDGSYKDEYKDEYGGRDEGGSSLNGPNGEAEGSEYSDFETDAMKERRRLEHEHEHEVEVGIASECLGSSEGKRVIKLQRSPPFSGQRHDRWVESRKLSIVTWGDSDLCVISRQCRRQGVRMPTCLMSPQAIEAVPDLHHRSSLPAPEYLCRWINLKEAFRQHFRFDARGGLENVVNSLPGLQFEGRAHSALVDARNTGKIALRMCEQSFRFTRPTRGLGPDGEPWGGGKSKMKALPQDGAVAKSGVPSAGASGSGSATYSNHIYLVQCDSWTAARRHGAGQ